MEFKECLLNRRSIRNFSKEKVSDKTIKDIITAGIYAPSACNFEAWKFIVLKPNSKRKTFLENPIAINAPYGILITYRNDLYVSGRVYKDYYQSAAAAIQNMLLYIASIKLGAVWICGLPKAKKIKKAFNIPKNFDVIGYVAFGHPLANSENTERQMIYHYGDEKSFKEHKRRYNIKQVLCDEVFYTVEDDCTYTKYPTKIDAIIRNIKNLKRKIIKKIKKTSNNTSINKT